MPGYVGLQLAVELTNILPVRQWAADGINSILDLARDLRKSGSDIVVEEDLADVLGRGRVSRSMEKAFKDVVKISKFTPLYTSRDGSTPEVELHSGPGPTVLRAFQDARYFTTVLTLSMLGYYHNPDSLAIKLSTVMDRRFEANIQGARPSPGIEGISATIESCSSQTSAFQWASLGQQIETRLRTAIPDYHFSPNYHQLTAPVLLGAVDFFYRVQQLPLHRKVFVSSESGCIVLILWAHHILDLTVVVTTGIGEVVFGNAREPHVHILWTGDLSEGHQPLSFPEYDEADTEQLMQLMDKNATVIISCEPDESDSAPLQHLKPGAERHPLAGYCTTFIRRVLNTHDLTPDDDPIFTEVSCLVTSLAMIQSRKLRRGKDITPHYSGGFIHIPYHLEAWRILTAAKMLFRGIPLDESKVSQQIQYYTQHRLSAQSLPPGLVAFLETAQANPSGFSPARQIWKTIISMTIVVLIFSHVSELDDCSDAPLVMTDDYALSHMYINDTTDTTPLSQISLTPHDIFHSIVMLLDCNFDAERDTETYSRAEDQLFLYSSLGWTVHLTTVGDEDPSILRPEIIHLRRGTPVNVKTKERKKYIRDGPGFVRYNYPNVYPRIQGSVIPKPAARLLRRTEYWSSLRHGFQAFCLLRLEPCEEWSSGVREIDGISGYWQRHMDLWETHLTPACSCGNQGRSKERNSRGEPQQPQPLHLSPDVAALVGWSPGLEGIDPKEVVDRIIVLLTCGDRHLRWLALERQPCLPGTERSTMLRSLGCCEKCALAHVESLEGKWTLVL